MNILNNQEAFAALQKGKNLLCRYMDGDFLKLDQFPATVFGMPDYEFCIDIEKIELAGFTFTKPCTLDELMDDQEIYVIDFSCSNIYKGSFNSKSDYVCKLVDNGVVQRDLNNASDQLRAFQKVLGVEMGIIIKTVDFIETGVDDKKSEVKQTKKRTSKKDTPVDPQLLEAEKDIVIDGIHSSKTECEIDSLCYDLEKHSFTPEQLKAIENAKDAKLAELASIKAAAESEKHELFTPAEEDAQAPELSVLCEAFIDEISNSKSKEDLDFIRSRINSNGALTEVENAELFTRLNIKAKTFEKAESNNAVVVAEVKKTEERKPIEEEEGKYQKKLTELKKRVDESKTVAEVNAVTKYTNSWSAEQRAPLLQYMHKRLEELKKEKQENEPSLYIKIQNAPDLAALDAYEIDIHSLEPLAQPKMMQAVITRRKELDQTKNDYLIDEDLP
ncbi:hypothetical protein BFR80_014170 [Acinetobacter pittii]|uniref:hypothetical protein n=1 Tax=Acinetobacter calcoaceticus/baumannii complex TaxID=909768 RepID=UPI00070F9EE1|nr:MULTISPECIES: hypothetical protein [Acinetobacter calcoaceticus/baumannii complex]KQF50316.1 hypothetical protein APC05_10635 [Acinetobacter pittii]KQF52401.1 hypothetical protein APC05_24595 [Acinetobacter pittii]MCK0925225.1 hypothetical protein [Acinetobacter pittii]OTK27761.1 hypothetical protein B9X43_08365 [Acinetobacter baumannii]